MSSQKSKMVNKHNLPESRRFFAGEQQQSGRPFHGKWEDPKYLAMLEKRNQIRESKNLPIRIASEVASESKKWIYPDWLQQEELTILVGPPSAGKTTFACALAAGITREENYSLAQGLTPTGFGHVIIVNREDNIATGLKARLQAAGADLTKVHFIDGNVGIGNDSPFSFSSDRDLNRLDGLVQQLNNNLGLIIIDPVYCVVEGDQNHGAKAREAYEGLARLSKRLTCAVLGIAHTVRNTRNKDPLARVAGPPALREVPRAIILLSKISNGPTATGGTHVLVHAKNNEGKSEGGFEYRLTPIEIREPNGSIETTKFVVTAPLSGSAEDILNQTDKCIPVKSLSKFDTAVNFLRGVLADGPLLRIEVEKLAEEADVSMGTLLNAKAFLKIVTKKREGDGRSVWRLPDSEIAGNPQLD